MATKIPVEVFLGLAAVAWADGSVRRIESAAVVRAATEYGLEGDALATVEKAMKEQTSLDAFEPGDMGRWERVLTYALAAWLAQIDGVVSSDEGDSLAKLGEKLGLDKHTRDRAAATAFDIAVLPQGGRPEKYDFVKLEARLREKLPQLAKQA